MRSPKKATAIALAGAVGLSSAAYALGTQADDGSAAAESQSAQSSNQMPGDPRQALDDLASKLGVDADELQTALQDYGDQHRGEQRKAFAAALAKALGKSADEVQSAFDKLEQRREGRFAARLADELGVDAADVEAALSDLRDEHPRDPSGFAAALAGKLGLDADKVESALEAIRPKDFDHHRRGAEPLRQLASELGVTRGELRKAFRDLRGSADDARKEHRADLVGFLAKRFGLSEDKVDAALPEFAGPPPGHGGGPGHGHDGPPPGFGGPPPGG
jgi:hypothetical protein